MSKLYKDMTTEEKANHYRHTEKYRKANPELSRAASRKYYHANIEKSAARAKNWRENNKEYVITKQREDKRKRKLEAIEYLGGKCQECAKYWHPSQYEFHHINPEDKDRDPSKMLSLSKFRLYAELDKCKLVCANCHRFLHHGGNY